jgi:hypothetical protein
MLYPGPKPWFQKGAWGYADLVAAIQNPTHERHEELLEWIGGEFDPEAFDMAAATRSLKQVGH